MNLSNKFRTRMVHIRFTLACQDRQTVHESNGVLKDKPHLTTNIRAERHLITYAIAIEIRTFTEASCDVHAAAEATLDHLLLSGSAWTFHFYYIG